MLSTMQACYQVVMEGKVSILMIGVLTVLTQVPQLLIEKLETVEIFVEVLIQEVSVVRGFGRLM